VCVCVCVCVCVANLFGFPRMKHDFIIIFLMYTVMHTSCSSDFCMFA
jgi:hypothetical protein